mgnify:CR=1 FL=1
MAPRPQHYIEIKKLSHFNSIPLFSCVFAYIELVFVGALDVASNKPNVFFLGKFGNPLHVRQMFVTKVSKSKPE